MITQERWEVFKNNAKVNIKIIKVKQLKVVFIDSYASSFEGNPAHLQ